MQLFHILYSRDGARWLARILTALIRVHTDQGFAGVQSDLKCCELRVSFVYLCIYIHISYYRYVCMCSRAVAVPAITFVRPLASVWESVRRPVFINQIVTGQIDGIKSSINTHLHTTPPPHDTSSKRVWRHNSIARWRIIIIIILNAPQQNVQWTWGRCWVCVHMCVDIIIGTRLPPDHVRASAAPKQPARIYIFSSYFHTHTHTPTNVNISAELHSVYFHRRVVTVSAMSVLHGGFFGGGTNSFCWMHAHSICLSCVHIVHTYSKSH